MRRDFPRPKRRAAFFIRQATAAMAPSNLLMGNPKALKALFDSDGQSIQKGFKQLQDDFDAGHGRINVTQSDPDAFELGVSLAVTPGEVVFRNPLIELIRYHATTPTVRTSPVLIFPPWINKYYVLDLTPANSLVAWLRDQGFTVYMVSWRSADAETKDFDWDDYLKLGGRAALDWAHGKHKAPVNIAGYCVGGALASIMAARLAQEGDDRIASLSLLAAQTDFSEPGDLGLFIDENSIGGIAQMIDDAGGVMPGEAMRDAFNLLRPEDLIWRYVEERYLLGKEAKAFDLLYWNSDQTNLPGPLHLASLKRLYLDNALARGGFVVEGKAIDLKAIKAPVFIHAARKDHISPFASVYKGVGLFGGDVTFLLADSGHIAGVVNPPASNKYRYWTGANHPPKPDNWLAYASRASRLVVAGVGRLAEARGAKSPQLKARRAGDVRDAGEHSREASGASVRETLESIQREAAVSATLVGDIAYAGIGDRRLVIELSLPGADVRQPRRLAGAGICHRERAAVDISPASMATRGVPLPHGLRAGLRAERLPLPTPEFATSSQDRRSAATCPRRAPDQMVSSATADRQVAHGAGSSALRTHSNATAGRRSYGPAYSPAPSSSPSAMLRFCTAAPDAPLPRLSSSGDQPRLLRLLVAEDVELQVVGVVERFGIERLDIAGRRRRGTSAAKAFRPRSRR